MSSWEDTYDIGGDGVPDDFDSVMDFDDGTDASSDIGADAGVGFGTFDADAPAGDLGALATDADAWIVDLDLGGLADVADIAVVAGVDDVAGEHDEAHAASGASEGRPLLAPLLAPDLTDVPDGADPFAARVGRRLDDDELRNEIRHLRITRPFAATAGPTEEPVGER